MLILSLDCAGLGCAACVAQDGHVLAFIEEQMDRGQDGRLMPLVEETMARSGHVYADLDLIAVTRGPGSFTGLRIGLAAARGLGLAAQKPVIGLDRFRIYLEQHKDEGPDLLVVLESRRLELYVQHFLAGQPDGDPALIPPDDLIAMARANPALLIAGDGVDPLRAALGADRFLARKTSEAETCALMAFHLDASSLDLLPRPLYLRAPDVTMNACKARS